MDATHSPPSPSHPSRQISHGLSTSRPCVFLNARISLVLRPSYDPYPHSASLSVVEILAVSNKIPSSAVLLPPEKSSLKVICALFRGLTYTRATRAGSISLPGPTSTLAVFCTWAVPCGVSSSSVMPVYRPVWDHSVSPVRPPWLVYCLYVCMYSTYVSRYPELYSVVKAFFCPIAVPSTTLSLSLFFLFIRENFLVRSWKQESELLSIMTVKKKGAWKRAACMYCTVQEGEDKKVLLYHAGRYTRGEHPHPCQAY